MEDITGKLLVRYIGKKRGTFWRYTTTGRAYVFAATPTRQQQWIDEQDARELAEKYRRDMEIVQPEPEMEIVQPEPEPTPEPEQPTRRGRKPRTESENDDSDTPAA